MTTAKKKPVHTIRRSGMHLSIWENVDAKGKVNHSINFERRYQKDGVWKSTKGFFSQDIAGLIDALEEADQWIELRVNETAAS